MFKIEIIYKEVCFSQNLNLFSTGNYGVWLKRKGCIDEQISQFF